MTVQEIREAAKVMEAYANGKKIQYLNDDNEWIDAVLYRGWEKKTGEYYYFVREKSDFESHFTLIGDAKTGYDMTVLRKQLSVLKEVVEEYPGKTIENVIVQIEARLKEIGNN